MGSVNHEPLTALAARVEAAADDLATLTAIDADLARRPEPEARKLRIRIAAQKFAAKKVGKPAPADRGGQPPPRAKSTEFQRSMSAERLKVVIEKYGINVLAKCGLEAPDGRALHRYRLDGLSLADLPKILRQRAPVGFHNANAKTAALFVLWAANWFQRDYRGGVRRWEDLGGALGLPFDGADGRRLTEEGLKIWRRPPVRGEATNQWLMTLAVEGGFPAGVLEDANGWAGRYLARIVGSLLAQDLLDPGLAFAAARGQAVHASVPTAYRQDIFYALAADFALAIVELRREVAADERASGMPVSAWLDETRPGWRDELPVRAGTEAAARLVDGLMRVEAFSLAGDGAVGCERILRRHGDVWRPALWLGLDGIAIGKIVAQLSGQQERLRAYPSAEFARYAAGELALFEPPAERGDGWRVRPSRRDPVIAGVPFTTPVTVDLRYDGKSLRTPWPGGEAIRSEIAVFENKGTHNAESSTLTLIGVGSGSFKPGMVVIAAPPAWTIEGRGGGASVEPLDGVVEDGRVLWRVKGGAILISPEGDTYRFLTGRTAAACDQLELYGAPPHGVESDEPEIDLFAGPPKIRVREGQRVREARLEEIAWRRTGERVWRTLREPLGHGRVELAWREPDSGFICDRRRLFILPSGAKFELQQVGDSVAYTPVGFKAAALQPADANLAVERRGESLVVRFAERPGRRARFHLGLGTGRALRVSAPFPLRSGIARWSGERIQGGSRTSPAELTLAELANCVAFANGPQILHGKLLDRRGRALPGGAARWVLQNELPLRGVAEDLAALLLPFADIDIWAELSFHNGGEFWRIRQFEAALTVRSGQLQGIEGLVTNETVPLFGRPVHDPATEMKLAQSTFFDRLNRRPPLLLPDLDGTWLVYLRRGEMVIARPSIVSFGGKAAEPTCGMAAAAMIADGQDREKAIQRRLQEVGEGIPDTDADTKWLVALIANLRGLPPASLDPLRLLASCPRVAARVAFQASDRECAAVLALAEGLPFLWCMVPFSDWERAAEIESQAIETRLKAHGVVASDLPQRVIEGAAEKLATAEPLLRWAFLAAGLLRRCDQMDSRRSLVESAQDHIRRHGDRVNERGPCVSIFRDLLPTGLLADFGRFHAVHLETLDAPCAAAAVAAGRVRLNVDAIRRIKTAARADPIYFAEAFDAHFVDLMNSR